MFDPRDYDSYSDTSSDGTSGGSFDTDTEDELLSLQSELDAVALFPHGFIQREGDRVAYMCAEPARVTGAAWTPSTHTTCCPLLRPNVHMLLLLQARYEDCTHELWLPQELWLYIFQFLTDDDIPSTVRTSCKAHTAHSPNTAPSTAIPKAPSMYIQVEAAIVEAQQLRKVAQSAGTLQKVGSAVCVFGP